MPGHAYVWRQFAPDLVAQAQPRLDRTEAGALTPRRVRLAVDGRLEERLENEAVRQQQIVLDFQLQLRPEVRADVAGRFDLEPVGREPLDPDRRPCLRITGPDVLPDPGDDIPPARKTAPPEGVD